MVIQGCSAFIPTPYYWSSTPIMLPNQYGKAAEGETLVQDLRAVFGPAFLAGFCSTSSVYEKHKRQGSSQTGSGGTCHFSAAIQQFCY